MKITKLLFYAAVGVVSGTMVGCGYVDDVSSEEYAKALEAQVKETYKQAFEKTFGKIDANQSWDLSTYVNLVTTRADGTITITDGDLLTVSSDLRTKVKNLLPEGKDNHSIGKAYTLVSQGPFDIYPIWHGECMQWTLRVNGQVIGDYSQVMSKMGNASTSYGQASTTQFTSTGWRIDAPVGTPLRLELLITNSHPRYGSDGTYAKEGDVISSVQDSFTDKHGNKINYGSAVLGEDRHNSVDPKDADGKRVFDMIVMFEDSNTRNCDSDFNDFILGIKGRPLPPSEVEIKENSYTIEVGPRKRYMVEDLGVTDDFDFNDIVVDMENLDVEVHKVTTKTSGSGEKVTTDEIERTEHVSRAIIRHLGGTLQWQLLVNGKEITDVRNGIKDLDVNEVIDLTQIDGAVWNPETNNIQVKVAQKDGNVNNDVMNMNTVEFPSTGAVPMMIATDTDKPWMGERVKINWGPFSGILDKKE